VAKPAASKPAPGREAGPSSQIAAHARAIGTPITGARATTRIKRLKCEPRAALVV